MSQYRHSRSRRPEDFDQGSSVVAPPLVRQGASLRSRPLIYAWLAVSLMVAAGVAGYWLGGRGVQGATEYVKALEQSLQAAEVRLSDAQEEVARLTSQSETQAAALSARIDGWASAYGALVRQIDNWIDSADSVSTSDKKKIVKIVTDAKATIGKLSGPVDAGK